MRVKTILVILILTFSLFSIASDAMIDSLDGEEQIVKNKGPVGVVDVDVKKQIKITDADVSDLSSDEEIKGKVKTQKDKLKQLRRG